MKKFLILSATLLSLMFTGCSNNETIDLNSDNTIGFKAMIDKNAARSAQELTTTNFRQFKVWGYKSNALIFDGQEVNFVGSWSYSPEQYWAVSTQYSFTAIGSNGENGCTAVFTTSPPAIFDQTGFGSFTFNNQTADGMEDLAYSYANRETTPSIDKGNVPVTFAFKHALSRVKFTFKNAISDAYTLRIGNLMINDTPISGTFTFPSEIWTQSEEYFTLQFTNGVEGIEYAQSGSTDYKYIIPGSKTLTISFDVVVFNKVVSQTQPSSRFTHKDVTLILPAGSIAYESGHSYNFSAELTTENINPNEPVYPIRFSASIDPWGNDENGTIDVKEPTNP